MCMNGNGGDSKLRILMKFKWTNSLLGYNPLFVPNERIRFRGTNLDFDLESRMIPTSSW